MITNWFAIPDHVIGQVFVVFIALVSCLEVIAGCFWVRPFPFVTVLCWF